MRTILSSGSGAGSVHRLDSQRSVGRAVVWNGANEADRLKAVVGAAASGLRFTEVASEERFAVAATSIAREVVGLLDPSLACAVLDRVVRAIH